MKKTIKSNLALEPHYTIKQIVQIWGDIRESKVREIFRNEEGVLRIRRMIRVPRSVLVRVSVRLANQNQSKACDPMYNRLYRMVEEASRE